MRCVVVRCWSMRSLRVAGAHPLRLAHTRCHSAPVGGPPTLAIGPSAAVCDRRRNCGASRRQQTVRRLAHVASLVLRRAVGGRNASTDSGVLRTVRVPPAHGGTRKYNCWPRAMAVRPHAPPHQLVPRCARTRPHLWCAATIAGTHRTPHRHRHWSNPNFARAAPIPMPAEPYAPRHP